LHANHVVAGARLHELDRQRAVLLEKRGRTVRIRDDGSSGVIGRHRVAASDDLFDGDLAGQPASVRERDSG
jgi:hypothetical protein